MRRTPLILTVAVGALIALYCARDTNIERRQLNHFGMALRRYHTTTSPGVDLRLDLQRSEIDAMVERVRLIRDGSRNAANRRDARALLEEYGGKFRLIRMTGTCAA